MNTLTANEQKVEDLRAALPQLPERDQSFARSLIESYDDRGRLSDKQFPWVLKLLERAKPAAERKPGEFVQLVDLFKKACENLKRPKLKVQGHEIDTSITISLAPATGVNAGSLYLKINGAYCGKVTGEGELRIISDFGDVPGFRDNLTTRLLAISENPVEAAREYGHQTGECCFCGKELNDKRSVIVGYGPVCAAKWNLPWGLKEDTV